MKTLTMTFRLLPLIGTWTVANADTFGTGANRFEIEFVEIGDPGNPADTSVQIQNGGALPGRVDHVYELGKFAISREIIGMVNAQSGLGITLGDLTDYGGNLPNRPATGISWNEAARFVNWLNASEGFPMAYKFTTQPGHPGFSLFEWAQRWVDGEAGFDRANPLRNSGARYCLPSTDEWYKASYYDPAAAAGAGGYWTYPNGSDSLPISVVSGIEPNTAVYGINAFIGPAPVTQAGGLSPYGVMGLGGNAAELVEAGIPPLGSDDFFFTYAAKSDWYAPPGWLTPSEILFNWTFPQEPDVGWHRNGIRVAAVAPSMPVLSLTNLRWSNQAVTADIESTVGNVDVYRAFDLDDFGTQPHLADLPPGTGVVIDPEATNRTAFYRLVPHGAPAP